MKIISRRIDWPASQGKSALLQAEVHLLSERVTDPCAPTPARRRPTVVPRMRMHQIKTVSLQIMTTRRKNCLVKRKFIQHHLFSVGIVTKYYTFSLDATFNLM